MSKNVLQVWQNSRFFQSMYIENSPVIVKNVVPSCHIFERKNAEKYFKNKEETKCGPSNWAQNVGFKNILCKESCNLWNWDELTFWLKASISQEREFSEKCKILKIDAFYQKKGWHRSIENRSKIGFTEI